MTVLDLIPRRAQGLPPGQRELRRFPRFADNPLVTDDPKIRQPDISQAKEKLDQHNIQALNEACHRYNLERSNWPDKNLVYLTYYGYASEAKSGYKYYQYTPYGTRYLFDASTNKVYRP